MQEVSALIFLASETKVNVKNGVTFFRNSLYYSLSSNDRIIFFTDKDFEYIEIQELVFVSYFVLLCNVYTSRYFCDKVFTRKSY